MGILLKLATPVSIVVDAEDVAVVPLDTVDDVDDGVV